MDTAIALALHSLWGLVPLFDTVIQFIAAPFAYLFFAAFVVFAVRLPVAGASLFDMRRKRVAFLCAALVAFTVASGIAVPAIRFLHASPRPFAAFGWKPLIEVAPDRPSFPSAHATALFCLATAAWWANRRAGAYFFAGAFLNSTARMYAGVHWATDIAFGALLGMAIALVVFRLLDPLHDRVRGVI